MKFVTIVNKTNGIEVGDLIGCAETSVTRLVGLLGKRNLPSGEGVWIRPSSGIHTFGMRFAIDVVGLDKEMRVVKLWTEIQPNRVTSIRRKVQSVVELAAGEINARSIEIGHVLSTLDISVQVKPLAVVSESFSREVRKRQTAKQGGPQGEWALT